MTGSAALATLAVSRDHDGSRLIAIDIGRHGAAALFVAGRLVGIEDLPTLADGPSARPALNAALLSAMIRRWQPDDAVVEFVAARPGEGAVGAFSFGRCRGVVEGTLAAHGVPVRHVTPSWWKRRSGVPPGADQKDMARSIALQRWPHLAEKFARKLDHDRAEAALIGLAHLENPQCKS